MLGIPVPPGFTITTELCTYFYENGRKYPAELEAQVKEAVKKVGDIMGAEFNSKENPLLLSVRSGALRVDAGHDGHRAEPRHERRSRRDRRQAFGRSAFRV